MKPKLWLLNLACSSIKTIPLCLGKYLIDTCMLFSSTSVWWKAVDWNSRRVNRGKTTWLKYTSTPLTSDLTRPKRNPGKLFRRMSSRWQYKPLSDIVADKQVDWSRGTKLFPTYYFSGYGYDDYQRCICIWIRLNTIIQIVWLCTWFFCKLFSLKCLEMFLSIIFGNVYKMRLKPTFTL